MNLLLTIIIPSLNASKTISNAIESILNQSFREFNLLIVDSASVDGTMDIVSAYSSKDSRVEFISEKDNGIYDAMNKGVKLARGKWVYFLGSDDILYSASVLSKVFDSQKIHDDDVLYGNVNGTVFNGVHGREFTGEMFLEDNICHQAIFYKRTVFEEVGFFDLRYKSHADWDHNMKWYFSTKVKKRYLDIIIAEYADGGFSAQNFDYDFRRVKHLNYLQYGRRVLKMATKLRLVKSLVLGAFRNRDKKLILEIIRRAPSLVG